MKKWMLVCMVFVIFSVLVSLISVSLVSASYNLVDMQASGQLSSYSGNKLVLFFLIFFGIFIILLGVFLLLVHLKSAKLSKRASKRASNKKSKNNVKN